MEGTKRGDKRTEINKDYGRDEKGKEEMEQTLFILHTLSSRDHPREYVD